MTPLFTTGGASWPSVWPVAKLQTGCSRLTLAGVISPSGLYPQPSKVRRNISQLPSSGFFSRAAVTGVYCRRISGIGPGTGVAEAGSIICCAEAPHMPAAAMAATHTLRMRILVITFPPLLCRATPESARNNADAAGERFRHRQLAVHDLERQRGHGARRRTIDDRRALARIVVRIMAGAFESLLLRRPDIHLAAGVRADCRIGDDALRRAIFGRAHQRRRVQTQQEDLVETGILADGFVRGIHRPCQERRAAERNVPGFKRVRALAFDRDEQIPLLRPLARRLRQGGDGLDRQVQSNSRYRREKAAPRRVFDVLHLRIHRRSMPGGGSFATRLKKKPGAPLGFVE